MRDTDLAVLELAATPDELRGVGLQGWRPEPPPRAAGQLDVVMLGVPVGAPLVAIPEEERYLRLGTCSLDADPGGAQRAPVAVDRRPAQRLPGGPPGQLRVGRPRPATGGLVGLINTTTYKGENGAECWLGRPCEVAEDGEASLPDTSYAQPVAGLEACFASDGGVRARRRCPLDPGAGVTGLEGRRSR